MWIGLRRTLIYVVLALALFACMYASRVFLTAPIVEWLMPDPSLRRIVVVAIVDGLLPALPLGIAYGLLASSPIAWKAFGLALGASVIELSLAGWQLPWWLLSRTWWVLPLECLTLVICFPTAAWAAARLRRTGVASTEVGQ